MGWVSGVSVTLWQHGDWIPINVCVYAIGEANCEERFRPNIYGLFNPPFSYVRLHAWPYQSKQKGLSRTKKPFWLFLYYYIYILPPPSSRCYCSNSQPTTISRATFFSLLLFLLYGIIIKCRTLVVDFIYFSMNFQFRKKLAIFNSSDCVLTQSLEPLN